MPRFFTRLYFGDYIFSVLLMRIQRVEGISNKVVGEHDKYYIFWDIENCTLQQAIETLSCIQAKYGLADIFIVSDMENSYRGFCFSKRSFEEYMTILWDTKHVDYAFRKWTDIRHKSVLRTSGKRGRPEQIVVKKLDGHEPYELPERFIQEIYETGLEKYPKLKVVKARSKR